MPTCEAILTIRPLALEDLHRCLPLGLRFHEEMQIPGQFFPDVFMRNWTAFLTSPLYPAVILTLWKDDAIAGGLGALIVPDLFDGRLTASEFFWFIDQPYRRGTGAIRLLKAFEAWAREHGAVEIRMVHLVGNHDEQLGRIYQKMGYVPLEVCYIKPVKKE